MDPLFSVAGLKIVVAGAGGGFGAAMTGALAERDAEVFAADHDEDALSRALTAPAVRVGGTAVFDATDAAACDAMLDAAEQAIGAVNALVNCVGLFKVAPALEMDAADYERVLAANAAAPFHLSRAAGRRMVDRGGGRIVHVTSVSSVVANPGYAAYAASKGAVAQLVRILALEWAASGVTVNAIGPALTDTGLTREFLAAPENRDYALRRIPMGRFGTPDDVLGALIMLLAPSGGFITGQTIYVDGGRTLV